MVEVDTTQWDGEQQKKITGGSLPSTPATLNQAYASTGSAATLHRDRACLLQSFGQRYSCSQKPA